MTYPDGSLTPEEMYWQSQQTQSAMPPPAPNASSAADYFGPPPPPAPAPPTPASAPVDAPADWNPKEQTEADAKAFMAPGAPTAPSYGNASAAGYFTSPGTVPNFARPAAQPDIAVPSTEMTWKKSGEIADKMKPKPAGAGGPSAVGKAKKDYYGTFDTEKRLQADQTEIEKARADERAAGMVDIASQEHQNALDQAREADDADRLYRDNMAKVQQQRDDILSKKVDPLAGMHDSGAKVNAVLGGLFGGLYQGLNHMEKNPFIEDLNRTIDRNIALQEKELARQERGVDARGAQVGLLHGADKDRNFARLQERAALLTAAKDSIEAQAAGSESASIQTKGKLAGNAIDRELGKLKLDDAAREAAAAAAARNAAVAKQERDREFNLKTYEAGTHRMAAEATANAAANKPKTKEELKVEEQKRMYPQHLAYIDTAIKDLTGSHPGDVSSKLPGLSLIHGTDARKYEMKHQDNNREMSTIVGHYLKDEEGRIPVAEYDAVMHDARTNPLMTDAEKLQRLEGMRTWINERAKTSGVYRAPAGVKTMTLEELNKR